MRRSIVPVALAALAVTAAALTVVVPGRESAPAPGDHGTPVLSPIRVQSPARQVAARRALAAGLTAIVSRSPAPSCLVVAQGGEPLFTHQAARPLLPASGAKLLTAVAALHAGAGDPDDVVRMLKDSDNDAADRIFAAIGPVSLADTLEEAGVPVEGVVIRDGSGLDRGNRATCAALHATVAPGETLPAVTAGLAVAGRDGTLRERFTGTALEGRLRAKTGSIRGVTALVGLVDVRGGEPVTFAHVLNDIPSAEAGVALQDELAVALARFVSGVGS